MRGVCVCVCLCLCVCVLLSLSPLIVLMAHLSFPIISMNDHVIQSPDNHVILTITHII